LPGVVPLKGSVLRIALVIKEFDPARGGAEKYAAGVAQAIVERGHELCVYAARFRREACPGARFVRVKVPPFPASLRVLRFAANAAKALRRADCDVIFGATQVYEPDVYFIGGGVQRHWLELKMPCRLLRWLNGVIRPVHPASVALEDRILTWPRHPIVIAVSQLVRRTLLERYAVPASRVRVLYPGVEGAEFNTTDTDELRTRTRRRLGIAADAPMVLFAANNFKRKGLGTFVRAIAAAASELPAIRLVVVGNDDVRPYKDLAARLGHAEALVSAGTIERMKPFYAAADLVALAGVYEPFGLVVLEGMACGTPAIVAGNCGVAELVRDGENGFVLPGWRDWQELADVLVRYFTTADRRAFSESACRTAAEHTVRRHADDLMTVLEQARGEKMTIPPSGFIRRREVVVNRDFEPLLVQKGLDDFDTVMRFEKGELFSAKQSRKVTSFVLADGARGPVRLHLKRHRQGLWQALKGLLRFQPPVVNGRREWEMTLRLRQLGIATPVPVAFGERRRCRLERESFTVTEDIADSYRLEDYIEDRFPAGGTRSASQRALAVWIAAEVARIARTLHEAGCNHQDLYLGHFFVQESTEGRKMFLIDHQRVFERRRLPMRYRVKDLGQLYYSSSRFPQITPGDRMRFFKAYLGMDAGERLGPSHRRLIGRIVRKAARIRRHARKSTEG